MSYPRIIRTGEQLDALDPETLILITRLPAGYAAWMMDPRYDLPAVVIASGDQVRAARKALEEA